MAEPTPALTADDVKHLKWATQVAFDRDVNEDGTILSQIRTWIKAQRADVYWGAIPVPSRLETWGADRVKHHKGFASIHACKFHPAWQTVLHLLRAGDELRLAWSQDNNSQTIELAGLHFDTLDAVIVRKGREYATIRLEDSICADNGGRMLRLAEHQTRLERHLATLPQASAAELC